MKKIISVLVLIASVMMLSGCFWIIDDTESSRFDITCYNNTNETITDWCVKQDNDSTYANSKYTCEIAPNDSDTIKDLKKGYYSLCITFEEKLQLHPKDYEQTNEIYLDEDVVFNVAKRKFYGRAATTTLDDEEEPEYVIIINGKEYPLVKSAN